MRKQLGLFVTITLSAVTATYANTNGHADIKPGECANVPVASKIGQSTSVLLGRVTKVMRSRPYGIIQRATLTVVRTWKGPHHIGDSLYTETPPCGGLGCEIRVEVGDVVLIFSPAAHPDAAKLGPLPPIVPKSIWLYTCWAFKGDEAKPLVMALDATGASPP